MLTAHYLSKSYDLQTLFENVSFSLNPDERIGLVGPNGCGKTTLIRILANLELPSSGTVSRDPHLRIGYLPQGFELDSSLTLEEILGRYQGNAAMLEDELTRIAAQLACSPAETTLQAQYDDLLWRIQSSDQGHLAQILTGLGLDDVDAHLSIGRLSGGQQTRLSLATVLIVEPQLLLLDEPTNHLDIFMLQWLEDWLTKSPCGALIISHDRSFLDHTVTSILDMDPITHRVKQYAGNYADYVSQRQEEIEHQWSAYNDQQAEIKRMQQDIIRTREQAAHTERQASSIRIGGSEYKQKGYKSYQQGIAKKVAKKAKSRQRKLDRFLNSGERVERPKATWQMKLEFNPTEHLGKSVVRMENLSVGYESGQPLICGIQLNLRASQRVALTGPNGCGKTTLLRTITGQIPPLSGSIYLSPNAHIGYLAQDQAGLDINSTPADLMMTYFPNATEARSFLAYYLIMGDEALKPVSLLSYGQRARLLLAQFVAQGCNCLLLDEPINHLDIPSRAHFEQALLRFEGAVLAVAHDRYFINNVADEIWWVENGAIRQLPEIPPMN